MIYVGQYLVIPVPQNKNYYAYQEVKYSSRKSSSKKRRSASVVPSNHKKIVYIVKKGNTLGEIAEMYNTRASQIRGWNSLYYGQHIYPNQKLSIWIPENFSQPKSGTTASAISSRDTEILPTGSYHIVRSGDTLWDISKKYEISIENLKKLNHKYSNKIKPGEKLKVRGASGG